MNFEFEKMEKSKVFEIALRGFEGLRATLHERCSLRAFLASASWSCVLRCAAICFAEFSSCLWVYVYNHQHTYVCDYQHTSVYNHQHTSVYNHQHKSVYNHHTFSLLNAITSFHSTHSSLHPFSILQFSTPPFISTSPTHSSPIPHPFLTHSSPVHRAQ